MNTGNFVKRMGTANTVKKSWRQIFVQIRLHFIARHQVLDTDFTDEHGKTQEKNPQKSVRSV